jgi:hypothetical protein
MSAKEALITELNSRKIVKQETTYTLSFTELTSILLYINETFKFTGYKLEVLNDEVKLTIPV